VVDDVRSNRQLASRLITKLASNISCSVAGNGQVAVEAVRERQDAGASPFSIIFMDRSMPVMDGLEALTRIKKITPDAKV
ncbi:unnamed protein product, partial [Chrysoparadoxa australica]